MCSCASDNASFWIPGDISASSPPYAQSASCCIQRRVQHVHTIRNEARSQTTRLWLHSRQHQRLGGGCPFERAIRPLPCAHPNPNMVKCSRVRPGVSARTTAALVLLVLPTAVAFIYPSISSILPPATALCDDGARFCWLEDGGASRGGGGTRTSSSSVVGGRIGRDGGGVASLRAEVLPEGGVSPCVIKVWWDCCS